MTSRKYIRASNRSPIELDNILNKPTINELSNKKLANDEEIAICNALTGLTNQQKETCLKHSGLIWAMLQGTQLGMNECVHQFRHEQWNCSVINILYTMHKKIPGMSTAYGLEGILQRGKSYLLEK